LAGLPKAVIERAKTVLEKLEAGEVSGEGKTKALIDELPLFNANPTVTEIKPSDVEDALRNIHPDELTPIDALSLIYELKKKLD